MKQSNPSDYEDDSKRELNITDPSGNNMTIEPAKCAICGAGCVRANEYCKGEVNMMSDMHMCEEHRSKRGAPNNWYESEPSKTESPFPRELGSKEASNFGFEFTDQTDLGDNYGKTSK